MLACLLRKKVSIIPDRLIWIDFTLFLYVAVLIIGSIHAGTRESFLALGKSIYLTIVFWAFRSISNTLKENAFAYYSNTFRLTGIVLLITSFIALGLFSLHSPTFLLDHYYDFPYTGSIVRLRAFTSSPTMLLLLLIFCFFFHLQAVSAKKEAGFTDHLLTLGYILAGVLTFSKSILLLFFGIALFYLIKLNAGTHKRYLLGFLYAITFCFLFLGTHFYPEKREAPEIMQSIPRGPYVADDIILQNKNTEIHTTIYFKLKELCFELGKHNLLTGCGPGNFRAELVKFQAKGLYQEGNPIYDPHSTLFGAFAETGIPGLLSLTAFLICCLLFIVKNRKYLSIHFGPIILIFAALISIELFSTDIMHIRHYWVLLGILVGTSEGLKKQKVGI
ncbi:MAG TPA: O-antigen ligase family protein [Bacteroidia bacterium]|nr:O-antigen ligase family protein [Bacteroidia bacterium]